MHNLHLRFLDVFPSSQLQTAANSSMRRRQPDGKELNYSAVRAAACSRSLQAPILGSYRRIRGIASFQRRSLAVEKEQLRCIGEARCKQIVLLTRS
mmetsp:Transcript_23751/g.54419  ORF Transcript_23751/g.54419 Transcript_23751/m.54419 type:complete len:96 (+) Transcript_23751:174-461(+)